MGQLGYTVSELYSMTPKMFYNAQKGLFEMNQIQEQGHWERARWMACVITNPHVKKNLKPKDLTTFPWDKKRRTKKNVDEIYKEAELFKKITEKKMAKGYGKKKGGKIKK